MKLKYHNLYRVAAFLISSRSSLVEWVRSHIGIIANKVADTMAKRGATEGSAGAGIDPLTLPFKELHDLCKLPITLYTSSVHIEGLKPKLNIFTTPHRRPSYRKRLAHIASISKSILQPQPPKRFACPRSVVTPLKTCTPMLTAHCGT